MGVISWCDHAGVYWRECHMRLCVDIVDSVMAAGLNDAGRGLNIVVVNSHTKDVIRVGHFDTFGSGL